VEVHRTCGGASAAEEKNQNQGRKSQLAESREHYPILSSFLLATSEQGALSRSLWEIEQVGRKIEELVGRVGEDQRDRWQRLAGRE
jgi:hypothetical protein